MFENGTMFLGDFDDSTASIREHDRSGDISRKYNSSPSLIGPAKNELLNKRTASLARMRE